MQYAVLDLCCVRVAVVRVERAHLIEPAATKKLCELQRRFGILPILLVAFSDPALKDVQGFSHFPTAPYVEELVQWNLLEPVAWAPLPPLLEPEGPF